MIECSQSFGDRIRRSRSAGITFWLVLPFLSDRLKRVKMARGELISDVGFQR